MSKTKGQRITLYQREADSPFGRKLLSLIFDICHDGDIAASEIDKLHSFLVEQPSEFPAAVLLRAQTREMLSNGHVDPHEAYRLKLYFVRIVPKEMRGIVETHLESIGLPAPAEDVPRWHHDPATARQIDYIVALGGDPSRTLTKGAASAMIESLLERRPPTPRQLMLLRFFDHMKLASATKEEVSVWIDHTFCDDRALRAWESFKLATNHHPLETDPTVVPVGVYRTYMK